MFTRFRWPLVALLAILLGCRSLSVETDLRQATNELEPRLGFAPSWPQPRDNVRASTSTSTLLRLDDAVRLAIRRHPDIRVALAELQLRRADLVQAGLVPNPALSLSFGFPFDEDASPPAMHSLAMQLSALWKRPARVAAAQSDLRAFVLSLCESTVALAASVGQSMAAVHHGRVQLELATRAVDTLAARVELLAEREEAGESTRLEVNAARLGLADARRREIDARATAAAAERRLFERLGASEAGPDRHEFDFSSLPSVDLEPPTEAELLELVATQRLDVAAAYAAIEGADARARLASLERWPDIDLGVGYNRNFQRLEALGPVGRIDVPIFDTGRAALAKAEAIERRTLAEADRILAEAILETRLAHVALISAGELRAQISADSLAPARDDHRMALESYEAGEGTRDEVLRREARLIDVERRHDEATLAVRRAYFDLVRAAGGALVRIDGEARS